MKKSNRKLWIAVWTVSLLLVMGALSLLCVYLYREYTAGSLDDDIASITPSVVEPSKPAESEAGTVSGDFVSSEQSSSSKAGSKASSSKAKSASSKPKGDVVNSGVNFTELWDINTDIYAWITIPNTNINYPVLQSDVDDGFYLSHNYKKQYEFAGCIYSEMLNKKDFSDPNTVLYGHNMLNGSMFNNLHLFRDAYFFEHNPYIYVYLPDRTLTYEIFSAYEYDDRHLLYSFDFNDREVFEEYLEYAKNPTKTLICTRRELDVTADDKIITLSTCFDNIDTSRYLVQGVLISDEPATR